MVMKFTEESSIENNETFSLQINVNHYFSVEKAKRYLNYEPKKINQAEWKIIVDSFQKYIAPSGIVNLF